MTHFYLSFLLIFTLFSCGPAGDKVLKEIKTEDSLDQDIPNSEIKVKLLFRNSILNDDPVYKNHYIAGSICSKNKLSTIDENDNTRKPRKSEPIYNYCTDSNQKAFTYADVTELRLSVKQWQKMQKYNNAKILPLFRDNLQSLENARWSCWAKDFEDLNSLKNNEQLTLYIDITQSHNLSYTCLTKAKPGITEYKNEDERNNDFNKAFRK